MSGDDRVTTFDLLRHGAIEDGPRYCGSSDCALSDEGWRQMWAAVGEAATWTRVVTSPLYRCAAFAEALAERHGLPLAIEPGLAEIDFGEWEGRPAAEVFRDHWESVTRFWADPEHYHAPGGEPLPRFRARVTAAWERLMEEHSGEHVLVVAHAGSIRMVIASILSVPSPRLFRLDVPYASLARIRVDSARGVHQPRLMTLAGTPQC